MPRFLLICLCLSAFTGCVSSQPANPNLETLEGYGEPVKQNDWGGPKRNCPPRRERRRFPPWRPLNRPRLPRRRLRSRSLMLRSRRTLTLNNLNTAPRNRQSSPAIWLPWNAQQPPLPRPNTIRGRPRLRRLQQTFMQPPRERLRRICRLTAWSALLRALRLHGRRKGVRFCRHTECLPRNSPSMSSREPPGIMLPRRFRVPSRPNLPSRKASTFSRSRCSLILMKEPFSEWHFLTAAER